MSAALSHAELLKLLPAHDVFKHFVALMQVPRPSHDLGKVSKFLLDFATSRKLESKVDSVGNIIVKRPATAGQEARGPVCVQAHIDMVCQARPEKKHDFHTDPITGVVRDGYLYADDTTLGADDGIGVAAALALLDDKEAKLPAIEALFTVDEETTMGGAENIDAGNLTAVNFINVDSEEEHRLCVGCAGGFEVDVNVALDSVPAPAAAKAFKLEVGGLKGGHTGIDAEKFRGNALRLVARTLHHCCGAGDCYLASVEGGTAKNAFPRSASAVFFTSADDIIPKAEAYVNELRRELELTDPGMTLSIAPIADEKSRPATCASAETTATLLRMMQAVPHGPLRKKAGFVETSCSFSMIDFEDTRARLSLFARSSSEFQMDEVIRQLRVLVALAGDGVSLGEVHNRFPGWDPEISTDLVRTMISTHKTLFGMEPDVYSVHAGLECGLIKGVYPNLICASIGPQIDGAHSPDERLKIDTVIPFYKWLVATTEALP